MPATPSPTLRTSLGALPRATWFLFLGAFLNKFGGFVVPFLAIYLTSRGYTLTDAALAISAYGVGNLLATLIGGFLADHLGRRSTIMLSMFSGAAAMMLLSLATSLPAVMALALLAGLTGELYRPASSALLADLVPTGGDRVTAFSAYRLAFNAGWAFGPATAGFLAGRGFFWLFVGDAATSVLFGLVALTALPKGRPPGGPASGWRSAWKILKNDRRLHTVLLGALAVAVVFFQMTSSFGVAVTHLGFSPRIYGLVISGNGVLIVLFELPLTRITRRFPALRVIAFGHLLVALGFGLFAWAHSVWALFVCATIFTFGEMCSMPVTSAYIADLAPADLRGRYMGAYGLTWALGLVVGPALGMKLFAWHPAALWSAGFLLGVLAATLVLSGKRPVEVPGPSAALQA